MKYSEFRRWLVRKGAVFTPGRGRHHKVSLNGLTSVFPNHDGKEMGRALAEKIKKDLGLK